MTHDPETQYYTWNVEELSPEAPAIDFEAISYYMDWLESLGNWKCKKLKDMIQNLSK